MNDDKLSVPELAGAIRHRLAQAPPVFGYLMMPRGWMEQVVAILTAPKSCIHCLGEAEPNGKCKNPSCIGAEFSFENPDGWPK